MSFLHEINRLEMPLMHAALLTAKIDSIDTQRCSFYVHIFSNHNCPIGVVLPEEPSQIVGVALHISIELLVVQKAYEDSTKKVKVLCTFLEKERNLP